ncbi:MAG: ribbon-helix-helix protein, CopG family [Candidatus Woesearchaeota archaeon]|nr:MAG: ribbon-helix-helix protein, CopG family [Candidatus Woesearchaeota archaeon]
MKSKLSVTIGEELIEEVQNIVKEGRFRNRSHIIEYALKSFLKKEKK